MASDTQILQMIRRAFAECRRPEHFTDCNHCEECAEDDEVLRSRDLDSLCIEDAGNVGWDPICLTSSEGFVYYLPALVRLALAEPSEPYGWFGVQLLFHLCSDGRQNRRLLACTPKQRHAVAGFLCHLIETRAALADNFCCADNLFEALEVWSEETRIN